MKIPQNEHFEASETRDPLRKTEKVAHFEQKK
jgi:hypothetical protein